MPQIVKNIVHAAEPRVIQNTQTDIGYERLFEEGQQYVFDGNRVVAHWRVGRNGVGRWRLYTINTDLSLLVTPDLRIRKYRRNDRTCRVRIIRVFGIVFDALKPLDEAVCYCAEHGHVWSLIRCVHSRYSWTWCLTCGAEQVRSTETRQLLEWPDHAGKISIRAGGSVPTLHGPVVGGRR